jgi:hypothetical protein
MIDLIKYTSLFSKTIITPYTSKDKIITAYYKPKDKYVVLGGSKKQIKDIKKGRHPDYIYHSRNRGKLIKNIQAAAILNDAKARYNIKGPLK